MIDLQKFCGTDECRAYLMKPFSRNGFTYATNGHIMLRVTERRDIPDVDKKFDPDRPLGGIEGASFFKPAADLPAAPDTDGSCPTCDGRGRAHGCPDCECECQTCGGSGAADPEQLISTDIGPKRYALNYVRQVLSLPGVEIEVFPAAENEKPMFFRFDDGVGALMPIRGVKPEHVDIGLAHPSNEGAGARDLND